VTGRAGDIPEALAEEGVPDTGVDASDLNALKAAAEVEAARYDRKLVVKPANSPGLPCDAGTEYGQNTGASPADIFRVPCSSALSWRLPTRATAKADRRLLVHTQRNGLSKIPVLVIPVCA